MADDATDAFFDSVKSMADSIGLTGREKNKYVHEHMIRAGYEAIPTYVKASEQDDDGDDFFSARRPKARRTRSNEDSEDSGRDRGSWF